MLPLLVPLPALLLLGSAQAWSPDNHQLIAELAAAELTPAATRVVSSLLGDGGLASVAGWADDVRFQRAYEWSGQLHAVAAQQQACDFVYPRDCPADRCVVGAVYNYTDQLEGRRPGDREEALKFITHLVADLHNPVHISHLPKSGGDYSVRFFGLSTNLHFMWDALVTRRHIASLKGGRDEFLRSLRAKLEIERASASASDTRLRPEAWAREIAQLACSVAEAGVAQGGEISEAYYSAALRTIEKQLVVAGVRLATLLNHAFAAL